MQRVGSRAQVMHGNAKMTGGGLRKKDLKYNKQGKIVSKKMSQRAKKEKRLQKAGYTTVKGQFGAGTPKTLEEMIDWVNETLEGAYGFDEKKKNKYREIIINNNIKSKRMNELLLGNENLGVLNRMGIAYGHAVRLRKRWLKNKGLT